jgi:hypothetical protein
MIEVTEEAHVSVRHGLIGEDEFREFVFANLARLWTSTNHDFLKGIVVEESVMKLPNGARCKTVAKPSLNTL